MKDTDNWEAFGGEYLKADNVTSASDQYVIISVDSKKENGKNTVILTVERNGIQKLFGCNATNEQAVQAACPESPKQAAGKTVTFNKVQVTNPATKQVVDGLRIQFARDNDSGINEDSTM